MKRANGVRLHIREMLDAQPRRHISFHTPGHKRAGDDITELSYSDDLSHPTGVLRAAEADVAAVLGASASFLLTNGSTSGIFSMLYAVRLAGGKSVAAPRFSHPSVKHACEALGLTLVPFGGEVSRGIPLQPGEEETEEALSRADALLLTSPDYYGFFAPLAAAHALTRREGKPLLVDGAHGSHLHGTRFHAGVFADLWVDGVHKSLPALTQGAVVSATEAWAAYLKEGVLHFRTTSPSYPILASVEAAVKYPPQPAVEAAAQRLKVRYGCVNNDDWTKLLVPCGTQCEAARKFSEARGVYPEFSDGNYLMYYLSPCTTARDLRALARTLAKLPRGEVEEDAAAGAIPMYSREGP